MTPIFISSESSAATPKHHFFCFPPPHCCMYLLKWTSRYHVTPLHLRSHSLHSTPICLIKVRAHSSEDPQHTKQSKYFTFYLNSVGKKHYCQTTKSFSKTLCLHIQELPQYVPDFAGVKITSHGKPFRVSGFQGAGSRAQWERQQARRMKNRLIYKLISLSEVNSLFSFSMSSSITFGNFYFLKESCMKSRFSSLLK